MEIYLCCFWFLYFTVKYRGKLVRLTRKQVDGTSEISHKQGKAVRDIQHQRFNGQNLQPGYVYWEYSVVLQAASANLYRILNVWVNLLAILRLVLPTQLTRGKSIPLDSLFLLRCPMCSWLNPFRLKINKEYQYFNKGKPSTIKSWLEFIVLSEMMRDS